KKTPSAARPFQPARYRAARTAAAPDVETEVVHGGGGAVALDQAACLDHEKASRRFSSVTRERARPPSSGHALPRRQRLDRAAPGQQETSAIRRILSSAHADRAGP